MAYNPIDWYWSVAGNTSLVWSSARMSYVPLSDPTYMLWQSRNAQSATNIGSSGELLNVLLDQWVPAAQGMGLQVVCGSDATLSGRYSIDPSSTANISAISTGIAAGKALPSGIGTLTYRDMTGGPHTFSGPAFIAFASAVETYLYAFNEALIATVTGNGSAVFPTTPVTFS